MSDIAPTARTRPPVRLRTVVFGLAVLAISARILLGALTDLQISSRAVMVSVLIASGAILVGSGLRSLRGERQATGRVARSAIDVESEHGQSGLSDVGE